MVKSTGSFRGAKQILEAPCYSGMYDQLNESTIRGWFEPEKKVGKAKKVLLPHIYERWQSRKPLSRPLESGRQDVFANHPDLLQRICSSLQELRDASIAINSVTVASIMKSLTLAHAPELAKQVKFSRRWCQKWVKKELSWSFKKGTTAGQKLPGNWIHLVEQQFLRAAVICYSYNISKPSMIINWDQTGLLLMPTHKRTYHSRKERQVPIVALEEKRQITAVVGSSMNGDLLPLQLIFTGQDKDEKRKKAIPNDKETQQLMEEHKWKLEQTSNHWSSLESMKKYVKTIIDPYINDQIKLHQLQQNEDHCLLIFDCWSVHKSKAFLEWINSAYQGRYHVIFIPAGCTSVAQPADVILQRPLKHYFQNQYTEWSTQQMFEQTSQGKKPAEAQLTKNIKALKPLVVKWMVNSWSQLKEKKEVIRKGWEKIGWSTIIDSEFQKKASQMVGRKELELNDSDGEQTEIENDKKDDDDDDDDDADDDDGDGDDAKEDEDDDSIEVALSRCIEKADNICLRRSTRRSTYNDAHMAGLLQEQFLDAHFRLPRD